MRIIEAPFKMTRKKLIVGVLIFIGLTTLATNFLYFQENQLMFQLANILGVLLILGPSVLLIYLEYSTRKDLETKFPVFLGDLVNNVRAGMTIPQALKSMTARDFGVLTPYVKQMAAQVDWGIPFDEVMRTFAKKSGSKILKRTVTTLIETHRSGGNIIDVLEAVSQSIIEVNRIKAERSSHIYGQMITGYTIFFVFLFVLVGLQKFLLPSLTGLGTGIPSGMGGVGGELKPEIYSDMFVSMIIIQAAFSGIAIGKMAEGSIYGGLKHSVALIFVGYGIWMASASI